MKFILALFILTLIARSYISESLSIATNTTLPNIKPLLDPNKTNVLVDEAFMEQKDILLEMLEAKLRQVRERKKKGLVTAETFNKSGCLQCETIPQNIILKTHGISAIGDTQIQMKFADGTLSLDGTGISNIGKAHVELGAGNGTVNIPGLVNLLTGDLTDNFKKNVVSNSSDIPLRRVNKGDDNSEILSTTGIPLTEMAVQVNGKIDSYMETTRNAIQEDVNTKRSLRVTQLGMDDTNDDSVTSL